MSVVTARGIVKRHADVVALDGVDFHAEAGTVTALVGWSGAGKTALLHAITGVEHPDEGTIGGTRDVAFLAQAVPTGLNFTGSIPAEVRSVDEVPAGALVGVEECAEHIRQPWESDLVEATLAAMSSARERGAAVVVTTHLKAVADIADRVLAMRSGRLVAEGPDALTHLPRTPVVPDLARPIAPRAENLAAEVALRCAHARWHPLTDRSTGARFLVRGYAAPFEWLTPRAVPVLVDVAAYRTMVERFAAYMDANFGPRVPGDRDGGPGTRPRWNRQLESEQRQAELVGREPGSAIGREYTSAVGRGLGSALGRSVIGR